MTAANNLQSDLDTQSGKVVSIHPTRRLKSNMVIDSIMMMSRDFTIHELYAKFPGKESSIQSYLSVLVGAGVLESLGERGTGMYRPIHDRNQVLSERVTQLERENMDLWEENYDLGLRYERLQKELEAAQEALVRLSEKVVQGTATRQRGGRNVKVANLR
jgi:hypothetical protein